MKEQELPQGQRIIGFDSIEEMNEYLDQQEKKSREAAENLTEKQKEITWGSYVIKMATEDLVVFGHVFTEEEFIADEALNPSSEYEPGKDEVLDLELEQLRKSHQLGRRYGQYFSRVLPGGEYGSSHVAALWPISKQDFVVAMASGWDPPIEFMARIFHEVQVELVKLEEEPNG